MNKKYEGFVQIFNAPLIHC